MAHHSRIDTWWRHQMETFYSLLALCAGNSPVTSEFPSQRPVTRSLDAFFHLRLNKRLSKQPRRRWFETPSRSLWRHWNEPQENSLGELAQSSETFSSSSSSSNFIPNRIQAMKERTNEQHNSNHKHWWSCRWSPEKPEAHRAGNHFVLPAKGDPNIILTPANVVKSPNAWEILSTPIKSTKTEGLIASIVPRNWKNIHLSHFVATYNSSPYYKISKLFFIIYQIIFRSYSVRYSKSYD